MNNNFNFNNYQPARPASPLKGLRDFFMGRSMLSRLIIINVAVFLLVNIAGLFQFFMQIPYLQNGKETNILVYWLALPSNPDTLLHRPWTIISYMFLHENFLHIFFNMLMLYFGGKLFTEYLGSKKLLLTYLLGGIFGGIFYVTAYNIFPVFSNIAGISIVLGASASVLAIIIAIATFIPDYSLNMLFIGKVKFKYMALIFVALDLLSIQKDNPGGHIAHLGGAFWGFIYILALKSKVIGNNLANPFKKLFRRKPKFKGYTSYTRPPVNEDDYNKVRADNQKKTDAILDKIKKSGYSSLTKEEKEFLFKASSKP
ncbi:MAG: rhomboid family intramembrane serine protease [Bacteroidota bacterium]